MDKKRFSTFLLSSGQYLKIEPPNEAEWNLIMLNFISGVKPISIINSVSSEESETPVKNTFITFNEGEPNCRIMNFRLNKKNPFQCFLNKKKSNVQFIFASNSSEKLIVEQLNHEHFSVGESINPNFPTIFMNEIQRIVKSEHPLVLTSLFIKKYEIRPYFYVHPASFAQVLSDSINFSLIQMTEKVVSDEISHYINFLDLLYFNGEELLLHDAIIIEKIITIFPQLKQKVNHTIIHTKNFYVFACFLMEKNLFDFSLLFHHLNFPDNIDIVIAFRILKVLIDEQVPFCSSMLKIFKPYVESPLLQMLLSGNKILYDSTVIPKQISNITPPPNLKNKLNIDNIINYDFKLIEVKTPEKNVNDKKDTNKVVSNFHPQKLVEKKKLYLSGNPEWLYEIAPKHSRKMDIVHHDRIFLHEDVNHQARSVNLSENISNDNNDNNNNTSKANCQKNSKQYNETIAIVLCALLALITLLYIWTHFSFYVL